MSKKALVLTSLLLLVLLSGGLLLLSLTRQLPELDRHAETRSSQLTSLDAPLVAREDAYLTARDRWLVDSLNRSLNSAFDDFVPPQRINVLVHRQPFSDGPWLSSLSPEQLKYRQDSEAQMVESHLTVEIERVTSEALLQFLVFADFRNRLDNGVTKRKVFLPPFAAELPDLPNAPVLPRDQFLATERMNRKELLAKPTAAYFVNVVKRIDERYVLRYDLLRNIGDERHVGLHIAAGQYLVAPSPAGAKLHLVTFYSGQYVPQVFDPMVTSRTEAFFQEMAALLREEAPTWNAPPEAQSWLRGVLE